MPRLLHVALLAASLTALSIVTIDQPLARWLATREVHADVWNQVIAILEYPLGIEPWKWTGICVLVGMPLNFANIIALPLLVGVGVDSGIHIVHRMQAGSPAGADSLRSSTSRAVFASAVTTVASFGNLAFASHYGMASMGQLLTLGMLTCIVGALVVLPPLVRMARAA